MMVGNIFNAGMRFYQSANTDADSIKDSFIIRQYEFQIILADIHRNPMKGSVQHYLLLGSRGSGKSTLLRRIQIEIDSDEVLKQTYIAINLAEEQANIYRLLDLLEEIIKELEHFGIEITLPEWNENNNMYVRALFSVIHNALVETGKKIILLLDNIDRIFENIKEDAGLLREILLNYDDLKIIGGSTRMTEHFWKYDQPFYQFFRILELQPLSTSEIKDLFFYWAKKYAMPQLEDFIKNKPGQLETIRILTDGLPRTLQFFVDIIINKEQDNSFEYIKKIIDYVTPLYQERLNSLPAAQRRIVLQLAFFWESVGTKELSVEARMDNNTVSAQLKQLTDKSIVDKIETPNKKHLYRIAERFFNLWLIFTQGSPREKQKAKYLTIFLECFYNEEELRKLANEHLMSLHECKLLPNNAALFTKAIAQSKYITSDFRDQIINKTLEIKGISKEMINQLPQTTKVITNEIIKLVQNKQWEKAIKKAETIEQSDGIKEMLIGYIYFESKDFDNAELFYKNAINLRNSKQIYMDSMVSEPEIVYNSMPNSIIKKDAIATEASYNLGLLYSMQKKSNLAEKFYLMAIENKSAIAMYNLARLYTTNHNDVLAEKYYLMAIDNNITAAMHNLAFLYQNQQKYQLAEKYYLLSVENKNIFSTFNLAILYEILQKNELAEKYYLMAIKNNHPHAIHNLAVLYKKESKYLLAEKYFLINIDKGDKKSMCSLVDMYYNYFPNKVGGLALITKLKSMGNETGELDVSTITKLWIIIKVWNGEMKDIQSDLIDLIKEKHYESLDNTLIELLIHYQINMVYNLFNNQEYGTELKDRFQPLYFATAILAKKDTNIELKIPPELKDTVYQLINDIMERRKFYYPIAN